MKYIPSTLSRGIGNDLLKTGLEKAGIELDIDWEKRNPENDKSFVKEWEAFDGQEVAKGFNEALQLIWDLGKAKNNAKVLCHQYERLRIIRHALPPEFDVLKPFEVGMYIYIHEGYSVLEELVEHIGAQDLSLVQQNHWTEYSIDPVAICDDDVTVNSRLATVLDTFFIQEKKLGNTQIEKYPTLYNKLTYFIAKVEDSPTEIEAKPEGATDYTDVRLRLPYIVTFRYDSAEGRFSLHALNIAKAKMHKLAAELIKALTGTDVPITRLSNPSYNLEKFAVPNFTFTPMPNDGYGQIYTLKLGILTPVVPGLEINFKSTNEGDAYTSLAKSPETRKLTSEGFRVTRIGIIMRASDPGCKDIKFELTEKTCSYRNLREEHIRIVEKLVDSLDIEI